MAEPMTLQIITPDAIVFEGQSTFFVGKAIDGAFGILPNHAPMIIALDLAPLRIEQPDGLLDQYADAEDRIGDMHQYARADAQRRDRHARGVVDAHRAVLHVDEEPVEAAGRRDHAGGGAAHVVDAEAER